MRILICGDREWNDFKTIDDFLATLSLDTEIIEGNCRGADKISGYLATKRGMKVYKESADWNKYGNDAGPIRNKLMIDKYHPDLVVAFHNNIEQSKGTKNMLKQAKEHGIETKLITNTFK